MTAFFSQISAADELSKCGDDGGEGAGEHSANFGKTRFFGKSGASQQIGKRQLHLRQSFNKGGMCQQKRTRPTDRTQKSANANRNSTAAYPPNCRKIELSAQKVKIRPPESSAKTTSQKARTPPQQSAMHPATPHPPAFMHNAVNAKPPPMHIPTIAVRLSPLCGTRSKMPAAPTTTPAMPAGDSGNPKNNAPKSAICAASVLENAVQTAKLRRANNRTSNNVAPICKTPAAAA